MTKILARIGMETHIFILYLLPMDACEIQMRRHPQKTRSSTFSLKIKKGEHKHTKKYKI